jgi:hypothetical protein
MTTSNPPASPARRRDKRPAAPRRNVLGHRDPYSWGASAKPRSIDATGVPSDNPTLHPDQIDVDDPRRALRYGPFVLPPDRRTYHAGVIHVRMSVTDLGRTRFAYSPLIEVAESLYMLSAAQVVPVHRKWFEATRDSLRRVDLTLL